MRKKTIAMSLMVIVLLVLSTSYLYPDCAEDEIPRNAVSIITLMTNPEKYHRKKVSVIGVGKIEFESDALYVGRDDYEYGYSNSIDLDFESYSIVNSNFNGKYVIVEGIFDKHTISFATRVGRIKKITRYDCWEDIVDNRNKETN